MRVSFRRLCLVCVVCLATFLVFPAYAESSAIVGQSYDVFYRYYQENVSFINDNASRHLLPLILTKHSDPETGGRVTYDLVGDTLSIAIVTDATGQVIEQCTITLNAPESMEYGSAVYNDFSISGYHSYALLMAMHADTDPVRRYDLVTDVTNGMLENDGNYTRQIGVYTLTCTRENASAVLAFQHNRVPSTPPPESEGTPPPDGAAIPPEDIPEDEGAGLL